MNTNLITSAYSETPAPTVSDIIKDPTYLPTQVVNHLDGKFLEDLLFRDAGANNGVVAFQEAAAPYLAGEPEEVAEFAEIPVFEPMKGGVTRTIIGQKMAAAIRISYEMREENKIDQVNLRQQAVQNTFIRTSTNSCLAAFSSASISKHAASKAWSASDADIVGDLFDAIEKIQSAKPDGGAETDFFTYSPDLLLCAPVDLTKIVRNESIQKLYIGDVAHDNPVYKGLQGVRLMGMLDVATSRWIQPGTVYVMQKGVAGFKSDTYPLTATPLYEEGGNSGAGGPRMTWRSDVFRKRILGVDNPKAVCQITGVK